MGTTLIAAMEMRRGLIVASVGDSRVYIYENGKLKLITEDQTWVNEVGRRLGIEEESLKTHPMRHVLTMAIGVSEQLRVHTYRAAPLARAPGAAMQRRPARRRAGRRAREDPPLQGSLESNANNSSPPRATTADPTTSPQSFSRPPRSLLTPSFGRGS